MPLKHRTAVVIWSVVATLVAAIALASAVLVWRGEREANAEAEDRAARFISGAEAALNRSLLGVDVVLAGMGELLESAVRPDRTLDAATATRLLRGVEHRNLMMRNLLVLGPDGRVVAAAQPESGRMGLPLMPEFVQGVLQQPAPQMAISRPLLNFTTSERSLYFARPLQLPDGTRGVAVAEMPVSLMATLLAPAAEVPGLQVTLERDDGRLLAAVPANELRMGERLEPPLAGAALNGKPMRTAGRLDGEPAIVLARPTLYSSVMVAASIPLAAALREYAHERLVILSVAAAFALFIVGVGGLTHWHFAGLERARREIAQSKTVLDQALGAMTDGFLLCDAQDRVLAWNGRYVELFPWLKDVIAPGVPFLQLAEAGAQALVPHGDEAARKAWVDMRLAIRRKGHGMYELDWGNGIVIDAVERPTPDGGTVTVIRDITAGERELARAKAAAEAANESKSRFLAAMSHEMRTPLNAVLGMNRLMLKTPLTDEQRRYAQMIRSSGQALLELINDILDLSKVEAGRMGLEIVDFSPAAVVENVVSLLTPRAQSKSLTLDLHLPRGLPPALRGDPTRLRQVLLNLVGNALKFTEQGGVEVKVSHRPAAEGKVELSIAVRDSGIGIAPEALSKLFERFVQADDSTARRYGGTGLGLAISAEIVNLMGGRIQVHSQAGAGSTFEVVLALPPGDASQLAPVDAVQETMPAPLAGGLHILVAEDNDVNQILIQALLKDMGHHCDIVDNGRDAVRKVQHGHYDLVLMDIQMPEMDGDAATRAIRSLPGAAAHVPVIALTANAMLEDRETYLRSGMDDYVLKPVNPGQLSAAIARVVG
ncbi:ATP-binding protein [Ideonella sp. BN130291]|uniref:ATP-binding protein n=1 Tax=Ideonella sp. BN130291 TaxID=3112940 RepID=UPI002E26A816|nr:ATP-binding protein [Ideonella sp. BN130291]